MAEKLLVMTGYPKTLKSSCVWNSSILLFSFCVKSIDCSISGRMERSDIDADIYEPWTFGATNQLQVDFSTERDFETLQAIVYGQLYRHINLPWHAPTIHFPSLIKNCKLSRPYTHWTKFNLPYIIFCTRCCYCCLLLWPLFIVSLSI